MDSFVSPKDEILFLPVCHHISNAAYTTAMLFPQYLLQHRHSLLPTILSSSEGVTKC